MTVISDLKSAQSVLQDLFEDAGSDLVVMTGAGISTESGIPDFRSPGGIWSRIRPIQYEEFVTDSEKRREDWRRRFEMDAIFRKAQPNAAHKVLADLGGAGALRLLITQNVDGLHQRAGLASDKMVELHGNSTYATCLACGRREELEAVRPVWDSGVTPVCPACGGLLKAAVVSFGQAMPEAEMKRAMAAAARASLFIVIGSSLVVYPAAHLPEVADQGGAEIVIINREETPLDELASYCIRTPIAETFSRFLSV